MHFKDFAFLVSSSHFNFLNFLARKVQKSPKQIFDFEACTGKIGWSKLKTANVGLSVWPFPRFGVGSWAANLIFTTENEGME